MSAHKFAAEMQQNFAPSAELFAQTEGCVPEGLTGEEKADMMNATIKKAFNRNKKQL